LRVNVLREELPGLDPNDEDEAEMRNDLLEWFREGETFGDFMHLAELVGWDIQAVIGHIMWALIEDFDTNDLDALFEADLST
jgi:hypothetical protein